MSTTENKRHSPGNIKRERQSLPVPAAVRKELSFALNEARALLTAAHVIESTVAPLAWCLTPERVQAAAANVRKQGPNLIERLLNVCTRMERLAVLASAPPPKTESRVPMPVSTNDREGTES